MTRRAGVLILLCNLSAEQRLLKSRAPKLVRSGYQLMRVDRVEKDSAGASTKLAFQSFCGTGVCVEFCVGDVTDRQSGLFLKMPAEVRFAHGSDRMTAHWMPVDAMNRPIWRRREQAALKHEASSASRRDYRLVEFTELVSHR